MRKHGFSWLLILAVIVCLVYINRKPEDFNKTVKDDAKKVISEKADKAADGLETRGKNLLKYFGFIEGDADESQAEITITKQIANTMKEVKEKADKKITDYAISTRKDSSSQDTNADAEANDSDNAQETPNEAEQPVAESEPVEQSEPTTSVPVTEENSSEAQSE